MSKEKVKDSLKNADEFLEQENLEWISKSSLHLRAFYMGLYVGVKQFVPDEDDLSLIDFQIILDTLFSQIGDDKFLTTELGKAFNKLKIDVQQNRDKSKRSSEIYDSLEENLFLINIQLDELESKQHHISNQARDILTAIKHSIRDNEWDNLNNLLNHLEDSLRKFVCQSEFKSF